MMEQAPVHPKPDPSKPPLTDENTRLTNEQLGDLENLEQQAEYRREYLTQLHRRACPGCGETDSNY